MILERHPGLKEGDVTSDLIHHAEGDTHHTPTQLL